MPCPYAHVLGAPGQGVHAPRFLGLALNDILATIALALVTSFACGWPFWPVLLVWVLIGEVLHYMFGTQTAFLTMIGVRVDCSA